MSKILCHCIDLSKHLTARSSHSSLTPRNRISARVATLAAAIAFSLSLFAIPAQATLDKNESSVSNDMTHFKTAKRKRLPISGNGTSHMHEITMDDNTIRQYADANGHIYAITWKGMSQPDLSVLLGDHYTAYSEQAKVRSLTRGGRGPRRIQTNAGVVVQTSGHMRALRGLAYIPAQLPAGVNADALQ